MYHVGHLPSQLGQLATPTGRSPRRLADFSSNSKFRKLSLKNPTEVCGQRILFPEAVLNSKNQAKMDEERET